MVLLWHRLLVFPLRLRMYSALYRTVRLEESAEYLFAFSVVRVMLTLPHILRNCQQVFVFEPDGEC